MNPTQIGPYEVISKIGSGGMGSVYLCRHQSRDGQAAVKVLPASLAHEEGFVERFNREIESMKKLSSPHIVTLYDNGVDNGTYYYAMEYVEGETLTQMLRRERRLPWLTAIDFGIQICYALKSAHDAGIIHRDLKPSNLLITPDGTVKLTDFGVAQVFATDRLTVTGGIVGTAEFMSPEQAQGKRASKPSDLYSLGAVLYAMVCGRPPFTGNTAVEVLQKHQYGRFESPRLINTELPNWLEEVIVQLLEKDPAKRFPDAYVVARRLESVRKKLEYVESMTETGVADSSKATIAVNESRTGPGPATMMKHLVRQELDQVDGPAFLHRLFDNTWFLISALVLVVLGGILSFRDFSPSPEERFKLGETLMSQGPGEGWIKAKNEYFDPLIKQDPQKWEPLVTPYLSQVASYVELEDLKRDLRKGRLKQDGNRTTESEPRRQLLLAMARRDAGDIARAGDIIRSVKMLLEGDPLQTKLYDLCDRLLKDIEIRNSEAPDRLTWIKPAFARAEKLSKEGHDEAAHIIWNSIITLYEQDPAASAYVQQARAEMAKKAKTAL